MQPIGQKHPESLERLEVRLQWFCDRFHKFSSSRVP